MVSVIALQIFQGQAVHRSTTPLGGDSGSVNLDLGGWGEGEGC